MTVYFIQAGKRGPIKIGFTDGHPVDRLNYLQCGSAVQLTLLGCAPGTERDEKALHRRFSAHRIRGEWFKPKPDVVKYARKLRLPPSRQVKRTVDYDQWASPVEKIRKKLKLTQAAFGESLGVHQSTVHRMECGLMPISKPVLKLLEQIAAEHV